MKHYVYLAALAAMLVAGCSTTNKQSAATTDDDDKVTVTGSRIPVKDRTAATKTTDKGSIDDFSRNQQIYIPQGGGGRQ